MVGTDWRGWVVLCFCWSEMALTPNNGPQCSALVAVRASFGDLEYPGDKGRGQGGADMAQNGLECVLEC